MRRLLPFTLLIFLLVACNQSVIETEESDPGLPMPQDIPEDFGFAIQFGIGKKNEINTFTSTFTKDLITAGTVTTDMTFTEEELDFIYGKMKEIKITDAKRLIPEVIDCSIEPYEEDEWEVHINGEIIRHSVSSAYCKPTQDAQQLLELRDAIFGLIKEKDSYKELPDAEGGYE